MCCARMRTRAYAHFVAKIRMAKNTHTHNSTICNIAASAVASTTISPPMNEATEETKNDMYIQETLVRATPTNTTRWNMSWYWNKLGTYCYCIELSVDNGSPPIFLSYFVWFNCVYYYFVHSVVLYLHFTTSFFSLDIKTKDAKIMGAAYLNLLF